MKILRSFLLALSAVSAVWASSAPGAAEALVNVKGYRRKDGTYVRPHVRSDPDGSPYNNFSYPGNYNPNTGKASTGNVDTYLKNYGSGSSYGTYDYTPPTYSAPTYTPPAYAPPASTRSCPVHATWNGMACACDAGYRVDATRTSCVVEIKSCESQFGPNAYAVGALCYCVAGTSFNALTGTCDRPAQRAASPKPSSGSSWNVPDVKTDKCEHGFLIGSFCSCERGFGWNDYLKKCVALAK